jgi:hypothetical protein
MIRYCCAVGVLFFSLLASVAGNAQETVLTVSVKNHQFQPHQLSVRANVPISIRVKNLDSGRMEFESSKPSVEKVIGGNSEAVIKLGPLAPGRYEFYDDFDQRGTMVLVVR